MVDSVEKIPLVASFTMFLLHLVDSNSVFQLCTCIVASFMSLLLSLCEVTKHKFFAQEDLSIGICGAYLHQILHLA